MIKYIDLRDPSLLNEIEDAVLKSIASDQEGFCIVRNHCLSADEFMKWAGTRIGQSFTISRGQNGTVPYDLVQDRGRGDSQQESAILSSGNKAFPLHTDCCYLQRPADVVVLYCIENSESGGESTLLNISKIIPALPDDYISFLLEKRFHINSLEYTVLERSGERYLVRYQTGDMLAFCPPEEQAGLVDGLKMLTDVLEDSSRYITVRLERNECLFVNNRTCLHGRQAFEVNSRRVFYRSRNYLVRDAGIQ